MARWWKSPLGIAGLVALLAVIVWFIGPAGYLQSYQNFSTLTKHRLVDEAQIYIRDRAGGDQMACLYVVQCDGGQAQLELVSDISAWDLQSAKDRIWHRRFSNYCPGRTTNLGLQLIPRPGHEPQTDAVSLARWSFFNDRFIPRLGRFQSGSFSDKPWEQCTPERAIVH